MKNLVNVNEIVFNAVLAVVGSQPSKNWTGTMSKLMSSLNRVLSKKQRTFMPGSPSALRVVINRVVNRLRNRGVSIRFGRTNDHMRTRFVKFTR